VVQHEELVVEQRLVAQQRPADPLIAAVDGEQDGQDA
jgi:hypothetical protein